MKSGGCLRAAPNIVCATSWIGPSLFLLRSGFSPPLPPWAAGLGVAIPVALAIFAAVVACGGDSDDGADGEARSSGDLRRRFVSGSQRAWPSLLVLASLPLASEWPDVLGGHLAAAQMLLAALLLAWRIPAPATARPEEAGLARVWRPAVIALLVSISLLYIAIGSQVEGSLWWDGYYYYGVARHIALTGRFEEPIVWHFLSPPATLAHAPFDYWGGLTSTLLVPVLWLFGTSHHVALVASTVVCVLSLAAFGYLVTIASPLRHPFALIVTLLLFAFSPLALQLRFDTESVPLFHLLLALALIAFARGSNVGTALLAFLLVLVRPDGLPSCAMLWGACAVRILRRPDGFRDPQLRFLAAVVAACLAVYASYHMLAFGTPAQPGARVAPHVASLSELLAYGVSHDTSLLHLLRNLAPHELGSGFALLAETLRSNELVPGQGIWLLLALGAALTRRPAAVLAAGILLTPLLTVHLARPVFTARGLAPLLPAVVFAGGIGLDALCLRLGAWMRAEPFRRGRFLIGGLAFVALGHVFLATLSPYDHVRRRPAEFAPLDAILHQRPVATTTPYEVIAQTRSPATSIPINGEAAIEAVLLRYGVHWLVLPPLLPAVYAGTPSAPLLADIYEERRARLGGFRLIRVPIEGASLRLFRLVRDRAAAHGGGVTRGAVPAEARRSEASSDATVPVRTGSSGDSLAVREWQTVPDNQAVTTPSRPRAAARLLPAAVALASAVAATPAADATETRSDRFAMRPWAGGPIAKHEDPEAGSLTWLGATLRQLVAHAWDTHPLDVESEGPDLAARFDLRARADSAHGIAALLRESLPPALGFSAEVSERTVRAFEIRVAEDAIPLEPSTAPRRDASHEPGLFRATRMPVSRLADFTRRQLGVPVFDETGLEGRYDWVLQWNPRGDSREILLALRDLGFEPTRVDRPVRFLLLTPTTPPDRPQ